MSDSSLDNPLENLTISFKYVGSNDLVAAQSLTQLTDTEIIDPENQ